MDVNEAKSVARKAAFSRREDAATPLAQRAVADALTAALVDYSGRPLSGYLPIRTEADPLPSMLRHLQSAPVGVPVVVGKGLPLVFRRWTPASRLVEGAFGVMIPEVDAPLIPEVLIVPMAAFDRRGYRLGYGGGFYDRTLETFRARGPVTAIGLAFAAQGVPELPVESTDQPLNAIVTEKGMIRF